MKKFFLLIFVSFCGLIFYQNILGKNGIIEGYRVKKVYEQKMRVKLLLENQKKENEEYIKYLKNDPDALRSYANRLGYFEGEVNYVRIIDENQYDRILNKNYPIKKQIDIIRLLEELNEDNSIEKKIKKNKLWIEIFFYIFFGFFLFLIIFGVRNRNGKSDRN